MPPGLAQKIILTLAFAALIYLGLTLYADAPRLVDSLARFDWSFLPLALGATLLNYALRFVRWHYYLGVIGLKNVSPRSSLLIFLSGFSLTLTPGKLGEVLKSLLLKTHHGTPISYSASIVIAERLTDVLGMVVLAAAGLALYPAGIGALALVLAGTAVFVILVQQRAFAQYLLGRAEGWRFIGRFARLARNLYEGAYLMLRLKPLVIALLLSTVAWFGECIAFFFVLMGIGLAPSPVLLLDATFIYAGASLFGAVSMLPGGLGATEGGMALLLQEIVSLAREQAIAATLVVRLCTLWFAVLLGVVALLALGIPKANEQALTGDEIARR